MMTSQYFSLLVEVVESIILLPQLLKTIFFNMAYVHQYMPNESIHGLIRDVMQGPF